MEFQEDQNHATNTMIITVRRRKSRKWFYENIHIEMMPVDVNKKWEKINNGNQTYCQEKLRLFHKLHFIPVYTQKPNYFNQKIPIFKGWTLNLCSTYQTNVIKKGDWNVPSSNNGKSSRILDNPELHSIRSKFGS